MAADADFLKQLRDTFRVEAAEHVRTLSAGFIALEKNGPAAQGQTTLEEIFRAAHSLKGAARAVEWRDIEALCQSLEDVFAAWRRAGDAAPPVTAAAMDLLHRSLDGINAVMAQEGGAEGAAVDVPALRRELRRVAVQLPAASSILEARPAPAVAVAAPVQVAPSSSPSAAAPSPAAQAPAETARPLPAFDSTTPTRAPRQRRTATGVGATDTVRVSVPKLQEQLVNTEELLVAKLATQQRIADVEELTAWIKSWRRAWSSVELDARRLKAGDESPELRRMLEFCAYSDNATRTLESRLWNASLKARHDRDVVSKSVDQLLDHARSLLLLPFSTISAPFARQVRDLAREQGKEADLAITGDHIELDKRVLEEIKDPLMHMLRNAVDHGVELPTQREAAGKPARASLSLTVKQIDGQRVQFLLTDDGQGIDASAVRDAALRTGALSPHEARDMDETAMLGLVFRSEVSTRRAVTHLSGRGLGLAIVRENVERLGGEVSIHSEPGKGSTLRIVVPVVRAAFRGILCLVAGRNMLVPTPLVERVAIVQKSSVRTTEGRETLTLSGRALPLVRLAALLQLPSAPAPKVPAQGRSGADAIQVFVAGVGEQNMAFAVDAIVSEQELLIKPLRKPLVRVRNLAATAVLGSGEVVPVLNVGDLLESARRGVPAVAPASVAQPVAELRQSARSVLVAEDSITSRTLLKTILESAGYVVKTAADGMEAFALLRTERFDLLVSDVEMPRLNGFELTARVRADQKLAELPVVLVTALATREDRERGIDAGANAYILKGGFEQDDLLETVRRLA